VGERSFAFADRYLPRRTTRGREDAVGDGNRVGAVRTSKAGHQCDPIFNTLARSSRGLGTSDLPESNKSIRLGCPFDIATHRGCRMSVVKKREGFVSVGQGPQLGNERCPLVWISRGPLRLSQFVDLVIENVAASAAAREDT